MKTTNVLMAGILVFVAALFTRCSPDYQDMLSTEELLTRTSWQVDNFTQSGTDVTAEFTDYQLFFGTDKTFTIKKDNTIITGTWQYVNNNNVESVTLRIDTPNTRILLLNENWQLKAKSPTSVQMEEVNGADVNQLRLRSL